MTEVATLPLSMARKSGPFVFVSGQLALQDGKVVGEDITVQTNMVIDAIERHLTGFGIGLECVIKTSIWLVRREDFAAFNLAYAARFGSPYPARSTVVSELVIPGALVEIEAMAVMPDA